MMKKLFFLLMMVLLGSTSMLRADELTVYDGTNTNSYVPIYGYYADCYVKSEYVIPASDLDDMTGGTINYMKFYLTTPTAAALTGTFQVYLAEVENATISAFYTGDVTVVYQGTVNTTQSIMTIEFTEGYTYNGGNLLVGFAETTSGNYKSCTFSGLTVTGASVQGYSCSSLSAITPSQRNFIPKTTFVYEGGATRYQVSAVVNPEGAGTVIGTGKYNADSECTLTASPSSAAYYFDNWTNTDGEVVATTSSYTFTVTEDVTFTANFAEYQTYEVSVSSALDTIGMVVGGGTFFENEMCTVYAAGQGDYLFSNWTVDGEVVSTSANYSFPVTGDVALVANFVEYETVTLFDGTITNYYTPIPLTSAVYYLQSQYVMPADYLEVMNGKSIKGLKYYLSTPYYRAYPSQFRVYITGFETETITSFVDPTNLDMVYTGKMTIAGNELCIVFDTPYDYHGGHLMIGIDNLEQGESYDAIFYGVDKRDCGVYTTSSTPNFSNFGRPIQNNFLPKTTFFVDDDVEPSCEVIVTVNPEEAGSVTGAGLYTVGHNCTVVANANAGYTFVNWTLNGNEVSTEATYTLEVTEATALVANFVNSLMITPNPVAMGNRPNNAWMRSYPVTISNIGDAAITINSITTDNEYFQINTNVELPIQLGYEENIAIEIMHTAGEGTETGNIIINYDDDKTVLYDMNAITYEPDTADVWETAVEVTEFPYQGTATGLYHNYMIPEAAEGANDAVYKITVENLSTLEVTTGSVESVFAVYPEDFNGIGGPDLENTYIYNGAPVTINSFTEDFEGGLNGWWTIDVNADGGTWLHSDENPSGYDYTERAHSGTGFAMCYSYIDYDGAYNTDSYMVTPQMYSIEAGSTLTLWADNANDSYPEYFTVCVATVENPTADDFIEIWSGSAKDRSNSQAKVRHSNNRYDNWRFHAIDLSAFAGQNVWIAFHDVNYDMYEIWIDDVELSVARGGRDVEGFVVEAGTYYVVVAAAQNQFPVNINLGAAPAPVAAQVVYPANEAVNVAAPCSFVWTLGLYTEEMQVLFGTDYPPTDVLIDWTDVLVNSIGMAELDDNTLYYLQVNERNATGTTEGEIITFASHLITPVIATDHEWYAYEGEAITVYWEAIDDEALLSYNIYVNNELYDNTTDTEFTFMDLAFDLTTGYDITVTAEYIYGESEKSNDVFFLMSGNGNVTGHVYEQDGVTPIADAVVSFEGGDVFGNIVGDSFTTDLEGFFEGSLPYGYYNGYASKEGYQIATCAQFTVIYNDTIENVDFMMNEVYTPVASVTVTTSDEAATVEWTFNERTFQFNRVYRALAYTNNKELVADSLYNATSYIDNKWADLEAGSYKYGVASVYDGNAGGNRDIEEIVIGEATGTNSYVPTYNYYNYSCTNQIYTAEEIGGEGTIYSIAFMPVTVNTDSRDIDIYMVNTNKTSFASGTDWVPVTSSDLVFSGTAYWTADEWSTITLDTPFSYDGTNLCVVVNDLTGSWVSSNTYNVFDATAQALRIYQDSAPYDPSNPGNGGVLNVKNCIKLGIDQLNLPGGESPIVWSDVVEKDIYTTLGITVTLNSGDSPEGALVTLTNVNEEEQELFPVEPVVIDETGTYTWDSFRKGTYVISISKEDYTEIVETYTISEATELTFEMVEQKEIAVNLQVSPTAYAMWDGAGFDLLFNTVETFYEDFENGIPEEWRVIDADGDGFNWQLHSEVFEGAFGYNGSADMLTSSSYDRFTAVALTPDNYIVTAPVSIVDGSVFSFMACAQDANYAAEHFGVAVSANGLNYTMVDEWTLTAKGNGPKAERGDSKVLGNWYQFSVDLSEYAGSTMFIALRHFNCTDMFYLNVDDVELSVNAPRHFEGYNVIVASSAGTLIYQGDVEDEQMQLPTENLVAGNTYSVMVAKGYSSGTTSYVSKQFVYTPCDEYEGVLYAVSAPVENGNLINWAYPEGTPLGVLIYRNDELLGYTYTTQYVDEDGVEDDYYSIRVVYADNAMSCEQEVVDTPRYDISLEINNAVAGNVTGEGTYFEGINCTITANADYGYEFVNWTLDDEVVSTNPTYTFEVTEDATYVANFMSSYNHWIVNPSDYEFSMNITGVVTVEGEELASEAWEVAVFADDECRGIARLVNNVYFDHYFALLTVYGDGDEELTFRLYNHIDEEESELHCADKVTFVADGALGAADDPYVIAFNSVVERTYNFTSGWNWWSTDIELTTIDGLAMLEEGLGENATQISAQAAFTNYYAGYGWYGSLNAINNESMYRVQMTAETSFEMVGAQADPTAHPITLTKGWNHIGFISGVAMGVNDALAGFEPTQGDMVKSQRAYANYYAGYGWYGSLNSVQPGDGLMYKSVNDNAITFTYPTAAKRETAMNLTGDNNHWVPNVYDYPYNMSVMAVVELGGVELASGNYELAAFANGECRGSINLIYVEPMDRYVAFLTVSGNENANMSFALYNVETGEECYNASTGLTYSNDAVVGTPDKPFVISFNATENGLSVYPNPVSKGETVRIMMNADENPVRFEIVNSLGKVVSATTTGFASGIEVPEAAGVYMVRVITEGNGVKCHKLVVK